MIDGTRTLHAQHREADEAEARPRQGSADSQRSVGCSGGVAMQRTLRVNSERSRPEQSSDLERTRTAAAAAGRVSTVGGQAEAHAARTHMRVASTVRSLSRVQPLPGSALTSGWGDE